MVLSRLEVAKGNTDVLCSHVPLQQRGTQTFIGRAL